VTRTSLSVADAVATVRERGTELGAYVSTRLEAALEDAEARAREKRRSPLHGVPFGLKDEWETIALPTTAGSWRHKNRRPHVDSKVFTTFRNAGAVLIGKTNLSDMGLAAEATSFVGGPCKNPHDLERSAGGSSGGAACAVAARMQIFDWGTDIGGSIRLPAAFCGVLGLRLSSACWPIEGLFPRLPPSLAWMCGQGPFAHTTEDLRTVLDVARPALKTGQARPFRVRGAAVYAPEHLGEWPGFMAELAPHLRAAVDGPIVQADLPAMTKVRTNYGALWASHFEELLSCDESIDLRQGIGAVVSSLVFRGRFGDKRFHPLTAELLGLMLVGRAIYRDRTRVLDEASEIERAFTRLWDQGLLVVAPVSCYPAPRIGTTNRNTRLIECCLPGNVADATALAVPFGKFGHLPRAIQLMGPPGSEDQLLDIADWLIASIEP
jgi:Asp-tRNA(Asn)/Glu-tRNA(Gln) amidotransferase A subunit family amidase